MIESPVNCSLQRESAAAIIQHLCANAEKETDTERKPLVQIFVSLPQLSEEEGEMMELELRIASLLA